MSSSDTPTSWYYRAKGESGGGTPVTLRGLQRLAQRDQLIDGLDEVRHVGSDQWMELNEALAFDGEDAPMPTRAGSSKAMRVASIGVLVIAAASSAWLFHRSATPSYAEIEESAAVALTSQAGPEGGMDLAGAPAQQPPTAILGGGGSERSQSEPSFEHRTPVPEPSPVTATEPRPSSESVATSELPVANIDAREAVRPAAITAGALTDAQQPRGGGTLSLEQSETLLKGIDGADRRKGFEGCEALALAGNPTAMGVLGWSYYTGRGVPENDRLAWEWWAKGRSDGDTRSVRGLADLLIDGKGVDQDIAGGIALYEQCVAAGDGIAARKLGWHYHFGKGVKQDMIKALDLYRKAVELGDVDGLVNIGFCYRMGDGVDKDLAHAAQVFEQASRRGSSEGMCRLGLCYQQGEGVTADPVAAFSWYSRSAKAGDSDGMALLSVCYLNGVGTAKDCDAAITWLKRAADLGNEWAPKLLAYNYLGEMDCTPRDPAKAIVWLREPADAGDVECMYELARLYDLGEATPTNHREAARWYGKAAELGYAEAMDSYGSCFYAGAGVAQDYRQAVAWFMKAARAGSPTGMTNLGHCLFDGYGVPVNRAAGLAWTEQAARAGEEVAKRNLIAMRNAQTQDAIDLLIAVANVAGGMMGGIGGAGDGSGPSCPYCHGTGVQSDWEIPGGVGASTDTPVLTQHPCFHCQF